MEPGPPSVPRHCLRQRDRAGPAAPTGDPDGESTTDTERAIRCRACGAPVTDRAAVGEVDGQHVHTFFNPSGVLFEIRCFDRADGCEVVGERTTEFTWFPGYAWNYGVCAACAEHLGWHFAGPAGAFFGLIRDRLAEG